MAFGRLLATAVPEAHVAEVHGDGRNTLLGKPAREPRHAGFAAEKAVPQYHQILRCRLVGQVAKVFELTAAGRRDGAGFNPHRRTHPVGSNR
ncbi:MAG: hypothetical protein QNK18_01250 [Gammaproteobacteria bacterium]|nr:hypothetical protein [Gammaproteobacteria bacterium]MDJ0889809.1 hypothetical protein [Gammaproteobacteria bacterium]